MCTSEEKDVGEGGGGKKVYAFAEQKALCGPTGAIFHRGQFSIQGSSYRIYLRPSRPIFLAAPQPLAIGSCPVVNLLDKLSNAGSICKPSLAFFYAGAFIF